MASHRSIISRTRLPCFNSTTRRFLFFLLLFFSYETYHLIRDHVSAVNAIQEAKRHLFSPARPLPFSLAPNDTQEAVPSAVITLHFSETPIQPDKLTNHSSSLEKTCYTAEEIGNASVSDSRLADIKLRRLIKLYLSSHGGHKLRKARARVFCSRGFILSRSNSPNLEDRLYHLLTAAALGVMLNRTVLVDDLIGTEDDWWNIPMTFQNIRAAYKVSSSATMNLSEARRLWGSRKCAEKYDRNFKIRIDVSDRLLESKAMCDDWSRWTEPVIWMQGASDAMAIQWFLRNKFHGMRFKSSVVMGTSWRPESRPNLFGELAMAFLSPLSWVEQAIDHTLRQHGGHLDYALIMEGQIARFSVQPEKEAVHCLMSTMTQPEGHLPHVAVISVSGGAGEGIARQLEGLAKVILFDASKDWKSNLSSGNMTEKDAKRSAALAVQLFLAARAKRGIVSGGSESSFGKFAQLAAAFGAAAAGHDGRNSHGFQVFSSFHSGLFRSGLSSQTGLKNPWHAFAGPLGCESGQQRLCIKSALLPYLWWDGPLQSPHLDDLRYLAGKNLQTWRDGTFIDGAVEKFCHMTGLRDNAIQDLS